MRVSTSVPELTSFAAVGRSSCGDGFGVGESEKRRIAWAVPPLT